MPVRLDNHPIAYYPVPKVASTSVMQALYKLDNGREWVGRTEGGKQLHIHNGWKGGIVFRPLDANDAAWRFALVRDPVDRVVSCYRNRVRFHKDLGPGMVNMAALEALGLPANPNLDQFVRNLEAYRVVSRAIAHHSRPQLDSLGLDLEYFHRVYTLDDLDILRHDLRERTGVDIELPHAQSAGPKLSRDTLKPRTLRAVRQLFAGDYVLLKRYFAPPCD